MPRDPRDQPAIGISEKDHPALLHEDYRTLVEQAPVMIWRAGTDAMCDYFNARWLAFTGRSLAEEIGTGWSTGVHAEDLDRCLRTFQDAFVLREPFEMEYRL